ncbi:MAG: glycosyltransferase [Deltaproteobacteria bacterium]|nr:glycosyltransferase [Deltaproteobacteria bacterium]
MGADYGLQGLRVALVHDWLTGLRGGERVLDCLARVFPQADLFTLFKTARLTPAIEALSCTCSPIQRLPGLKGLYRHFLPLFPWAVSRLDLSGYDLVISTSHCVAKGALPRGGALHLSYVFTPMRYIWDLYPIYFGRRNLFIRATMRPLAWHLRQWDRRSCSRVHHLACISQHVAERIRRHWGREAEVIHPPLETDRFYIGPPGDYYLIVSALAPYKGLDLAVRAAHRTGFQLIIAGQGQEMARLKKLAGPTVRLLGRVSDQEAADLYANCRAFIFPGEEDFGITPLEAMASGKPVIALGWGGVWETVIPANPQGAGPPGAASRPAQPPTGIFFYQPSPQALIEALEDFEAAPDRFEPQAQRTWASRFDQSVFIDRFKDFVARAWAEHRRA